MTNIECLLFILAIIGIIIFVSKCTLHCSSNNIINNPILPTSNSINNTNDLDKTNSNNIINEYLKNTGNCVENYQNYQNYINYPGELDEDDLIPDFEPNVVDIEGNFYRNNFLPTNTYDNDFYKTRGFIDPIQAFNYAIQVQKNLE